MRAIIVIAFLSSSFAEAVCDEKSSCDYTKEWSDFTRFVATYSNDENSEVTNYEYLQTENELVVNVSSNEGTITLLSIDGIGTLYKGIDATGFRNSPECYSDVGDTYAILQGYAVSTLYFIGIGSDASPDTINQKHEIKYEHQKGDPRVQINPGNHLYIGSPWYLSGSLEKGDEISYSIHHKYSVDGELKDLFIAGLWSTSPIDNGIPDSSSLDGWLVCIGGRYIYDNSEQKYEPYITDTTIFTNVGQLRAQVNESTQTQ